MLLQAKAKWHTGVESGTVLVKEGEVLDRTYLLLAGSAASYEVQKDKDGKPNWGQIQKKPIFLYKPRKGEDAEVEPDHKQHIRSCIIGGTALTDPNVMGTPYPNRVIAGGEEPGVKSDYIEFGTETLLKLMAEDPAIQAAIYQCLYVDMLQVSRHRKAKIKAIKGTQMIQEYTTLMKAVLADHLVHPSERKIIQQWREDHSGLTQEMHSKVLEDLGWTDEEFEAGIKVPAFEVRHKKEMSSRGGTSFKDREVEAWKDTIKEASSEGWVEQVNETVRVQKGLHQTGLENMKEAKKEQQQHR